ncbi:uncharacterized protein BDR25DRAFT_308951 [Lindgomyces ingoldianus]|uniref:Uncharacterized protein n=1 Tax=Lindgomyces ingoldianus TaxID=673940 RepID=A0ACB6RFQ4_9PLEO|nr:uncharacterized protein BDR25DRAFT_308951 [Lindgomyces ingoldianus]KAF2478143.1 hypothetical protein BDR25DRAFT_308951 [Lindgomyces ingoldianus]
MEMKVRIRYLVLIATLSLLISISFQALTPITSAAQHTIEPRAETTIPPDIIGYTSTQGKYSPFHCLTPGETWLSASALGRCCPTTGDCPIYTACVNGSVIRNDQFKTTCTGTGTQTVCVTGTVYESVGDLNPMLSTSSTTSPQTSPTSPPSTGISGGKLGGLISGAVIGGILLGVAGLLIYRKWGKGEAAGPTTGGGGLPQEAGGQQGLIPVPAGPQPALPAPPHAAVEGVLIHGQGPRHPQPGVAAAGTPGEQQPEQTHELESLQQPSGPEYAPSPLVDEAPQRPQHGRRASELEGCNPAAEVEDNGEGPSKITGPSSRAGHDNEVGASSMRSGNEAAASNGEGPSSTREPRQRTE